MSIIFCQVCDESSADTCRRDYVADNYWPQAKKESKRVTGSKILDLYGKMYVKESTTKPTNGTDVATKVVPNTEDNAPDLSLIHI